MRPKSCEVWNFGSYEHLSFSFDNLGLATLTGGTGSGKSTVADILAWICWGITSKGGSVESVRRWGATEPTKGTAEIDLPDGSVSVTRVRGRPAQTDLYWTEAADPDSKHRGKDIADTQRLLDKRLGIDAELYELIGYFAQFSESDKFFTAKPKDRRETAEKIADLSFPVLLAARASERRKLTKKELEDAQSIADHDTGRLVEMKAQFAANAKTIDSWEGRRTRDLEAAKTKSAEWSTLRQRTIAEAQAKVTAWEQQQAIDIITTRQKADNWLLEHMKAYRTLKNQSEDYEKDRVTKIAQYTQDLETCAARLSDLPDYTAIVLAVDEQQTALTVEREVWRLLVDQRAAHKAQRVHLQAQHTKFSKKSGICPECMGPAKNVNSEAFLRQTSTDIDGLNASIADAEEQIAALEAHFKQIEAEINTKRSEAALAVTNEQDWQARMCIAADALQALETDENPYTSQLVRMSDEPNPHIAASDVVKTQINPHVAVIKQLKEQTDPHAVFIDRLAVQENPHRELAKTLTADILKQEEVVQQDGINITCLSKRVSDLTMLYDLNFTLRGELLRNSVKTLERDTNSVISEYFDGEFRVGFTLDADKLDVAITKGEYDCEFAQLSGGQRRILVVAFFWALRRAAMNKAGVDLSVFIGDEMLNGLSDDLKAKAYRLFEAMSNDTETVLLIDHSDTLKGLFGSHFEVECVNGNSSIRAG